MKIRGKDRSKFVFVSWRKSIEPRPLCIDFFFVRGFSNSTSVALSGQRRPFATAPYTSLFYRLAQCLPGQSSASIITIFGVQPFNLLASIDIQTVLIHSILIDITDLLGASSSVGVV